MRQPFFLVYLLAEYLNHTFFLHEVGEFSFKACSPHHVVVDPVIIATTRLAENDAVVFETGLVEPAFRYFSVRFGA